MSNRQHPFGEQVDDAVIRKALAQLKPPSATAVLDDDMLKTMNELNAVLRHGKRNASEIQRLLDAHTSKITPVKHTCRHRPPLQLAPSLTSIISLLNTDLFYRLTVHRP
jgi:hypothetical protein